MLDNMVKMQKSIIKNSKGLKVLFLKTGMIESINVDTVRISLKPANIFSELGINVFLRQKGATPKFKALLRPDGQSEFAIKENSFEVKGSWDNLDYICTLQLSEKSQSWQWNITVSNHSSDSIELDLIYVQDVGLLPLSDEITNEYYISQYIERRVLKHDIHGAVICCRQNIKNSSGNPWLMMLSTHSAVAASVDGMQFYGNSYRETGIPEGLQENNLTGEYAGELSVLALQERPFKIFPNHSHHSQFTVTYLSDHPTATSAHDLEHIPLLLNEFVKNDINNKLETKYFPKNRIPNKSQYFRVEELTKEELVQFFGLERRHIEEENGQLLSFFSSGNNHIVLRAKESLVDRPHGHILQTHSNLIPNENIMASTVYMYGVFNSHLIQGNTNFNRLLSVCSSQFNLESYSGQRILIDSDGQRYQLGVPSAFEMGLNHCRWIYKHQNGCFQVRTWTSKTYPKINMEFTVLDGKSVSIFVTNHLDKSNGWTLSSGKEADDYILSPNAQSKIAAKFPAAIFRLQIQSDGIHEINNNDLFPNHINEEFPCVVIKATDVSTFHLCFIGELKSKVESVFLDNYETQYQIDTENAQKHWRLLSANLSLHSTDKDILAISEVLPWYGINALIHFLTPHGLEQIDGAAWGTRDTAQGPLELLISTGNFSAAKHVLRIIFSNQNTDGGWPQWWMFDSYSELRYTSSHADIYHWCIIVLSNYIKASGDSLFLDEVLPYYNVDGVKSAEKSALSEHVDRLIKMITDSFISNTSLVPFGGGDWNDSMQPVNPELAQRLISTWTVELNYQSFSAYQELCEQLGKSVQAKHLNKICNNIKTDFNQYLIKDGTVSGHGLIETDGSISLLLHPSDNRTGIQYRLLPMMRGIISGIFNAHQAQHHLKLIEKHLKGPDGARLMNQPFKYNGGLQTLFQRAESSPFFGRETGIMYTHAHIRYAEIQARMGNADAFIKALRQANPVAYREIVSCGNIRQANCYYSSSDVIFNNRYQANTEYADVLAGKLTVRGGWRIYSSGPGIYIGIIISHFLGLRSEFGTTIIDPVIPKHLDGMSASINYFGKTITFIYHISSECFSPKEIRINNKVIQFEYENNIYRKGGAVLPTDIFLSALDEETNLVKVQL